MTFERIKVVGNDADVGPPQCQGAVSKAAVALQARTAAFADCGTQAGHISIISNDFDALKVMADGAKECASSAVTVTANLTTQHEQIEGPALTVNPAHVHCHLRRQCLGGGAARQGLLRPLDDYVARYGQDLQSNQLIKVGGQVVAIAFDANSQHLFYRKDILDKAGVQPPKSYEDELADAKIIKDKGIMQYPLAAADKPGWDGRPSSSTS